MTKIYVVGIQAFDYMINKQGKIPKNNGTADVELSKNGDTQDETISFHYVIDYYPRPHSNDTRSSVALNGAPMEIVVMCLVLLVWSLVSAS